MAVEILEIHHTGVRVHVGMQALPRSVCINLPTARIRRRGIVGQVGRAGESRCSRASEHKRGQMAQFHA